MAQRPGGTSLNQRRQQAIQTLLKAKSTLAKLNAQRRKTLRLNVVNQKRGLQVSTLIVQKCWLIIFQDKPFPLRKHAYSNILKISSPKTENLQIKNSNIVHISAPNIDCGYSLEPPQ